MPCTQLQAKWLSTCLPVWRNPVEDWRIKGIFPLCDQKPCCTSTVCALSVHFENIALPVLNRHRVEGKRWKVRPIVWKRFVSLRRSFAATYALLQCGCICVLHNSLQQWHFPLACHSIPLAVKRDGANDGVDFGHISQPILKKLCTTTVIATSRNNSRTFDVLGSKNHARRFIRSKFASLAEYSGWWFISRPASAPQADADGYKNRRQQWKV